METGRMEEMKKIEVIIDWTGKNYCAAPSDSRIACVATGKTLQEVKANIAEGLAFQLEGMQEQGIEVPPEYLGNVEFDYVLTTRARLKYSDNFITRRALAEQTGIKEQQLSHYVNGWKSPRPATEQRILNGLRAIVANLTLVL